MSRKLRRKQREGEQPWQRIEKLRWTYQARVRPQRALASSPYRSTVLRAIPFRGMITRTAKASCSQVSSGVMGMASRCCEGPQPVRSTLHRFGKRHNQAPRSSPPRPLLCPGWRRKRGRRRPNGGRAVRAKLLGVAVPVAAFCPAGQAPRRHKAWGAQGGPSEACQLPHHCRRISA